MFDPLVPRPIDRPTVLAVGEPIDGDAADRAKVFAAPDDPAEWPGWRHRLTRWREDAVHRMRPDGAAYEDASTVWACRCYSVALVWLWDERLFDHGAQRFTPDRFLEATVDHGGFDAVVLWHAYPIIGLDERDQFDFYRDVPGLDVLVRCFHEHDIRVFVDYNPWDTAGRGSQGPSDHAFPMAALVVDAGADGVFLDTMSEGGTALVAALRTLDPPAVLEGETRVSLERITDHQISWAQWFADSPAPGVLRAHWYERRHMMHHTRRWNRDHCDELQSSWMNGIGIVVWDAVFGSWVGWNERDRSTLRSMVRAQRALSEVLVAGEWTPLTDAASDAVAAGVFASRWEHGPTTLWTVVNRGDRDFHGPVLDPAVAAGDGPATWFDVTAGHTISGGRSDVHVPARGIAGIVRINDDRRVTGPTALGETDRPDVTALIAFAAADRRSDDSTFPLRTAERRAPGASRNATPAPEAVVVGRGSPSVAVRYRLRETGMYGGAPFVEEWKPLPPRLHAEMSDVIDVSIGPVAVGSSEVTNAEFAAFLAATGYQPAVANRFLDHWCGAPEPPAAIAEAPVTHITLDDGRAFASWVGARLPTEFEWQVAAGDPAFRRGTPLVWNWTESEHSDGITRFVMLKGGCHYDATESEWYFDGGPRAPEFTAKLLLAGLGVERSSSIGFRLAWDLEDEGDT